MKLPEEFELENNNGFINIEPRIDGGIGIYYEINPIVNSVHMMMSRSEMHKMIEWLITWTGSQVNKEV